MKNKKICVICGKEYFCPPSDQVVTCSVECSKIRKMQTHKNHDVSDDTKEKIRTAAIERGFTDNLKKGTAAAMKSEKAGRGEKNVSSKDWILISPEGVRYDVHNLTEFIRKNYTLFGLDEPTDKNVAKICNGFRTIKCNMIHDRRGQRYLDWTIELID